MHGNDGASTTFFADRDLRWVHDDVLLWRLPEQGEVAEYKLLMFPAVEALLDIRIHAARDPRAEVETPLPGLIIDLRRAQVPDAAARAVIRAGLRKVASRVCGVALVVPSVPMGVIFGGVGRYLMGENAAMLSDHTDEASAVEALCVRMASSTAS